MSNGSTERSLEIAQSLSQVRERISRAALDAGRTSDEITLIAVTKTYPISDVQILAALGVSNFGENREAEGRQKSEIIPAQWHFQGEIQSKKISSIAKWASVIHSLDDGGHALRLNRAVIDEKKLSVFIQVNLDGSSGRGGVNGQAIEPLAEIVANLENLHLEGLMVVAPLGENPESAFSKMAEIHSVFIRTFPDSQALSMGMSGDFEVAIGYGATHIRIGSSILGSRFAAL